MSPFIAEEHGEHRRRRDDTDWRKRAPRWVLVVSLVVAATIIGALGERLQLMADRESQRFEAAITDAPSKYQARLSERVAVVEEQQAMLRKSVDALTAEVKSQNVATGELTTELRLLTAQIRQARSANDGR